MTVRFPFRLLVLIVLLATCVPWATRAGASSGHGGPTGTAVRLLPGAPPLPEGLSALSWMVADADSGEILAGQDAHTELAPASTLKILFALTVLPRLEADREHVVREAELAGMGAGSSSVGIVPGRTYRVSDLWNGVFLRSGNDAVRVLAAMNGGWRRTARDMEAVAESLGARDTHVVSPDGYDADGQVTTAHDLTLLGAAGLRDAQFARYASTARAMFPAGQGRDGTRLREPIHNTNRLLTGAGGVDPYPGLLGIKNGYTSTAGNTLVAAAERGGRKLVVTVMNPQSGRANAVYEEARELLDWGFAATGKVDPVGTLPIRG